MKILQQFSSQKDHFITKYPPASEQSTLNQASHTSFSWLKTVPLGQRKENFLKVPVASATHMWYI